MEYYENHQAEYETEQAAAEELENSCFECGEDEAPSQEEMNWATIYNLRDNMGTFSEEQKGVVCALSEEIVKESGAKARLYAEATTLHNNVLKLENFLRRRNTDGVLLTEAMRLTNAQVLLMQKQLELEKELYNVLVARLSVFDVRVAEGDGEKVEIVEE